MKKTIEFENKIIVIFHDGYCDKKICCNTFKEAYETIKNIYTDKNSIAWEVEDWNETFDFQETKDKFETYGYVEFCDDDRITTIEQFLDEVLNKIL